MKNWFNVCTLEEIGPDMGICALVDGQQVAIFRLAATGELFAVGNYDPFSNAQVLSRGILGDRGGIPKVASPVYKQSFALTTGECLDDANVRIPTFSVREWNGTVQIAIPQ